MDLIRKSTPPEATPEVILDAQRACDQCGRFGAFVFDGRHLCGDCYDSCGSCCPEFGRDREAADTG
jgi:hypothetical protein